MKNLYENLWQNDGQGAYLDKLMKRSDIYEAIGYHDYEALDETILKSVVPDVS
jgi:methylisocitrate lyase